jgi:hypothetical protein
MRYACAIPNFETLTLRAQLRFTPNLNWRESVQNDASKPDTEERLMKKILALTGLVTLLIATPGLAQDKADPHAGHHPPAANAADSVPMERMHENMQKMHELMDKIHASKNPEEARSLLEQHHRAINEQFRMMRGMMGKAPMPMMGMHSGHDDHVAGATEKSNDQKMDSSKMDQQQKSKMVGMKEGMMDEMMKHHEAMQQRLDMMQGMMEQMMEHMSAEHHLMQPEAGKKN